MISPSEYVLRDGGRLVLNGHSVARRFADGRVKDLSWWPRWKVVDLVREAALGGSIDGKQIEARLQSRRHPSFATVTAPVNWQDLAWALSEHDGACVFNLQVEPGELPSAVIRCEGRERFRLEAITRGALEDSRIIVLDDAPLINGSMVRVLADLLRNGGRLQRTPPPAAVVMLASHDGASLQLNLLREPRLARQFLEQLGVVSRGDLIQCGVQALAFAELEVLADAPGHVVVDF